MAHFLTIHQLLEQLRAGELSSREATQACLDRVEKVDDRLNAFISVDDDSLTITDEKSTNGIFVNGELTDESVLMSGYRIQIGKFNLIITKVDKQ